MKPRAPVSLLAALATLTLACQTQPIDVVGVAPTTLRDALLAHYTFDEGAGTVVHDHSGNRHDGALTGGAWIGDGQFAGALHLGANSYVTVDDFPDAPTGFTVSAWVRSSDTPIDGFEVVTSTEVVFEGGWELNLDKTDAGMGAHFGYWDIEAGTYSYHECLCLADDRWAHVVSAVDGASLTLTMYVNGQRVSQAPVQHAISPGTPTLYMGTWSRGQRYLVGDIDDVAIYSRPLGSAEVGELEVHPPPDPL